MNENHEVSSIKNNKVINKFQIETPKNIWIYKFVCLRSKMCSFKCGVDSKNKLKGIIQSHSKNIKFAKYKKCLGGEDQQECDNYFIRSIDHEINLQLVQKSTLSLFDDKRCYINIVESKQWNYYF